jgi:sulfate-transporting ATPase
VAHQFVFQMQDLRRVHPPNKEVLKGLWLSFLPGAKIGVLGHNGAGKSTLLRIMAGVDKEFLGEARPADGIRIGFLPQEPRLEAPTVRDEVDLAVADVKYLLKRTEELGMLMAENPDDMDKLMEEMSVVQDKIEACNGWELDRTIERAMDALRLPSADAECDKLSGGERRRVALCRLLLEKPDLLILDEPTNHLDAESVHWLERFLQDFPGTVVSVTHDRYFLDNVAGWILELDRGHGYPFEGNYSAWLEYKQKRLADEQKQETSRKKTLERELEWVRSSPRARQAKSKARIASYESLLSQDKDEKAYEPTEIRIPAGNRLGNVVIEAKSLRKSFGDRLLIDDLTFSLPRGGIVGVIGPNGAGKTTLFRMIIGQEKPDSGEIRVGETVQLAYVDQSRDSLNPKNSVWQEISGGEEKIFVGKREVPSRAYVSSFNFAGSDQQKKVGDLSGGERNRVHMAKLLRSGGNVLLLDEPSNDLDVDTLRSLEEALLSFAGCAVVISHDRWFLDRVATHILAFEGDSKAVFFEGNYEAYEADLKRRIGKEADEPRRFRYRKMTDG